jgi:hypothetical protein
VAAPTDGAKVRLVVVFTADDVVDLRGLDRAYGRSQTAAVAIALEDIAA